MRHRKTASDQAAKRTPWQSVQDFFMKEEVPYGLAILRFALPLILFLDLLKRWPNARELYSADGATTPIWIGYGFHSPFPEFPGPVVAGLFTLMMVSLLTASIGWMTRASLIISSVLYFYFTVLDCMGTLTKYTVISSHLMMLLAMSQCGAIWSVDAYRQPYRPVRHAVWPRRLIQLFIGIVYLGAAMTKMHTPAYLNGDQMLYWTLTHINEPHPVGETMGYYPALLMFGAYFALVWEILFLPLCWRGLPRLFAVALGVQFHIGTYLLLGLYAFPAIYCAVYFAFFGEREYVWARKKLQALISRRSISFAPLQRFGELLLRPTRVMGPTAYFAAMWMFVLSGIAAERAYDPYGERGPDGPLPLQTVKPEVVQRMLGPSEPLRAKDKIFLFELGTTQFADTVLGRKTEFAPGEMVVAHLVVPPPHEDMYVECNLCDGQGRLIERNNGVITREAMRYNVQYPLCQETQPGEYSLVLMLGGHEVARRHFTVVAQGGSPNGCDQPGCAPGPTTVVQTASIAE